MTPKNPCYHTAYGRIEDIAASSAALVNNGAPAIAGLALTALTTYNTYKQVARVYREKGVAEGAKIPHCLATNPFTMGIGAVYSFARQRFGLQNRTPSITNIADNARQGLINTAHILQAIPVIGATLVLSGDSGSGGNGGVYDEVSTRAEVIQNGEEVPEALASYRTER
jgi:hypothetical protein